jgi:murein DD-endopeptidase MepM/ murein hydrolase activator NlpD
MMGGRFFHDGSDIAVPRGTPVRAVSGGRVKEVSFTARKGNYLVIAHFPGVESVYLHLDKTRVSPGERVNKKTVIGFSGSSGFSTGPHLHFEIRLFSVPFPAYLMCLPGRLFRAARGLERGTASGGGD